jgi:hypothetical protein
MGKDKGDKPKRPLSAYMIYSTEKRPEIQAANPGLKLPDISKKIGALWKGLSASEKKPYEDKAAKCKSDYSAAKSSSGKSSKPKKAPTKSKAKKGGSSSEESED